MLRINLKSVLRITVLATVIVTFPGCSNASDEAGVDKEFYDWCIENLGDAPSYCCPHAGGDVEGKACEAPSVNQSSPVGGSYGSSYDGLPEKIPGDGDFLVGEYVRPGTWLTDGNSGSGQCRWWISTELGGGEILDEGSSDGPTYAQIVASAAGFHTEHCLPWTPIS